VSALTTASACFRPGELAVAWLFVVAEPVFELPELPELQAARVTARATGAPAISMRCHGGRDRWLFFITDFLHVALTMVRFLSG
jgi:hypothetical protein